MTLYSSSHTSIHPYTCRYPFDRDTVSGTTISRPLADPGDTSSAQGHREWRYGLRSLFLAADHFSHLLSSQVRFINIMLVRSPSTILKQASAQTSQSATLPQGMKIGRSRGTVDLYDLVQAFDGWTEGELQSDDFFSPHYAMVFEPFLDLMVGLKLPRQQERKRALIIRCRGMGSFGCGPRLHWGRVVSCSTLRCVLLDILLPNFILTYYCSDSTASH